MNLKCKFNLLCLPCFGMQVSLSHSFSLGNLQAHVSPGFSTRLGGGQGTSVGEKVAEGWQQVFHKVVVGSL